jgi:pimeloyl-ACP methyl ester carboxylesterase
VQAASDVGIAAAVGTLKQTGLGQGSGLERGSARREGGGSAWEAWVERTESALDGLVGDFLAARNNPLAIRMCLRQGERPLRLEREELGRTLSGGAGKVCIFIHGLGCSDTVWKPSPRAGDGGLSFGDELARLRGYAALYLRYNTGQHISENGRALALLLSELVLAYPVDLEQVVLVGHSMGGLVARSAVHYGKELGQPWVEKLTHVLSIGTPHFGAPLERASNLLSAALGLFDAAGTQVPAKVLRARSAGIKDLCSGSVLDEDWMGRDVDAAFFEPDPSRRSASLVDGVAYGYVAARVRPARSGLLGEWLGDLLVQVPSASGQHRDPARSIPFHMGHVVEGAHHVSLTTHPMVYRQLDRFLTECPASPPAVR